MYGKKVLRKGIFFFKGIIYALIFKVIDVI